MGIGNPNYFVLKVIRYGFAWMKGLVRALWCNYVRVLNIPLRYYIIVYLVLYTE